MYTLEELAAMTLPEKVRASHQMRREMMDAVRMLDREKAEAFQKVFYVLLHEEDMGMSARASDRLRSVKNMMLSFNTLYSFSAEEGGMSAMTGHYKAERYAIMIERAVTEQEAWRIFDECFEEYMRADLRRELPRGESVAERVDAYISMNFTNSLSIDEIAGELHLSAAYMMRKYKKETGRTIQHVITERRLNEACRMLATSSLSLTEICMMVGFNSSSYFCQVFRSYLDISPKQYREHMKGHYFDIK